MANASQLMAELKSEWAIITPLYQKGFSSIEIIKVTKEILSGIQREIAGLEGNIASLQSQKANLQARYQSLSSSDDSNKGREMQSIMQEINAVDAQISSNTGMLQKKREEAGVQRKKLQQYGNVLNTTCAALRKEDSIVADISKDFKTMEKGWNEANTGFADAGNHEHHGSSMSRMDQAKSNASLCTEGIEKCEKIRNAIQYVLSNNVSGDDDMSAESARSNSSPARSIDDYER